MLVLSRKKNETIVIAAGTPYETTLVVVEIRGDKVRLGVNADPSVSVHRGEVQAAIAACNGLDRRTEIDATLEAEIRELQRLTEQVRKDPSIIAKYDLRTVALNRMESIGDVNSRLYGYLRRFVEFANSLTGPT